MYRRLALAAALTVVSLLSSRAGAVDITVDCDQHYQQMQGIGAHLYNWSGYTTSYYPTEQFLTDYLGDLGNSMVRFELHPNLCTVELPLASMEDYNNYTMDLRNSSVDSVLSTLRNIVQRDSTVKIIGTVWTPPGWMKTNAQNSGGGNLLPAYYGHFARYLYQYYRFLQDNYGVTLYAMSAQNELRFSEPYNSCIYDKQTYRDMMKVVGAYFDSQNCPVLFFGPEDMTHWADQVVGFVDSIMDDPDAQDDLDIIATHGYLDGVVSGGGTPEQNMELYTRLKHHGLPFWMTETSGEAWQWESGLAFGTNGSPLEGALDGLASKMHTSFVYGFVSGWTYWAYGDGSSLGQYGFGPSLEDFKYTAHKHYSKFIRPGAWRVAASPDGGDNIWVSAYHHEANGTLTLVLLNTGTQQQTVNLRINDVTVSSLQTYLTTATQRFYLTQVLPVSGGAATFDMPARSMITLTGPAAAGQSGSTGAPSISMSAPTYDGVTIIPVTLTIDKNFGYYSTDGVNYTQIDMVYNGGSVQIPITETSTLYYFASDGVDSTQIYTQAFTVTHPGATAYQFDAGTVTIEAENYLSKAAGTGTYASYQWEQRDGPLNSWVMQALPNDNQVRGSVDVGTEGPVLNYEVNFEQTGTYYIWVRGTGPAKSDHWYNSTVSWGMDGSDLGYEKFVLEIGGGIYENKLPYDYMQWQNAQFTIDAAGVHTMSFWMRADGFKLDKFILTTSPDFRPDTYLEPPESPALPTIDDIQVSRIDLSWTKVDRAYAYRLYYRNVTAGDSWTWGNQVEVDSATANVVFAVVDGDSLHANTEYEFHVAAVGPQAASHNWNPPGDTPVTATTLVGGSGGYQGFESANLAGYPIARDGVYLNQGYEWTFTRGSSEWSTLGGLDGEFDRAIVTYGTSSSIVSEAIPGGFGSLSFTIARHGYPSGGQYAVLVNGTEVGRTHQLDWSTYDHFVYTFPGANVTGDVIITINNLTPDNGNDSRGSIDDVRWTGYAGGAPDTPTGVNSAFVDSGLTLQWTPVSGATGYRVFTQGIYPEQYTVTASTTDAGVYLGDRPIRGVYNMRVTALNDDGESPWSDTIQVLPMKCGAMQNGLYGYYYDGRTLSGDPVERLDTAVAFSSFSTEPVPGVGTTDFSVVWVGQVQPEFSETYTFYANYDDGARLWVNGEQLVDDWNTGGGRENGGTVDLQAGEKYHILMQYLQAGGGGRAELSWSSASVTKEIIPSSRLWTGPECTPGVEVHAPRMAPHHIEAPFLQQRRYGIAFGVPADMPYRVALYDMSGRLVAQHRGTGGVWHVSTRELPTGLYVLRLHANGQVLTRSAVVRH